MKLVMTIISNKDVEKVIDTVAKNGYFATKVSTTGQFLVDGNTTILIGCQNDQVDNLCELLRQSVTKRVVKSSGVTSTITGSLLKQAVDVEEYGGVAFIIDVEDFKKF